MTEKAWNAAAGRWEVDGVPIGYRVTWRNIDDGSEHSREFADVDQGFDFYQAKQRSANAYDATWEHLPY